MNNVQFKGSRSGGLLDLTSNYSPSIWADCPLLEIKTGNLRGWFQEDDFTDTSITGTQTTNLPGVAGKYKVFCSTAGAWATVQSVGGSDIPGGIISALCDTAGDAAAIGFSATPFLLNGTGGKMWGEARFAQTGIATNNAQLFVGLCENSIAAFSATVPLGDADTANASAAMIGLNVLEDGLGVLNACYQDRSATWVNPTSGTGIGQMAANTFIKVGWVYDPTNSAEAFSWYVNGVKKATITAATLAALTNLDVKGLGLCAAMFADSAGLSNFIYLDWWRCYQLAP